METVSKDPLNQAKWEELKNNVWAIENIEKPSEEMCLYAVKTAWNTLKFIKNPSDNVLEEAVSVKGWAIQFIEDPSIEIQKKAVEKDWDSIKYVIDPIEEVQLLAVNSYYGALKYIKQPTLKVKRTAITKNAEAVNFLEGINEEEMSLFIEDNIDIIKYVASIVDIEIVKIILKKKLSCEDIEPSYVIKFVNCEALIIDKADFIHEYGSEKAKRIFVDYKLSY